MALGRTVIDHDLRQAIHVLIEQHRAEAQSREQAEIAAGKQLFDAPKPTIIRALTLKKNAFPPPAIDEEDVPFWRYDGLQYMRLKKGTTTYLTARRMWSAYVPVANLLRGNGFSETHIKALLLRFFPHVYGVLTIVRYCTEDRKKLILLGVRSDEAGSYSGFVSFPGGMTDCGETLDQTAAREFSEEIGHNDIKFKDGYEMFQETERPNFTFARFAQTQTQQISKCNEWKGKVPVWAPEEMVVQALDGKNEPFVKFLRNTGLTVPDTIAFAPDVIIPAQRLLKIFKDYLL